MNKEQIINIIKKYLSDKLECDSMIIKKFNKNGSCEVLPQDNNISSSNSSIILEKTRYGFQILPDVSAGAGPIYFALIKKI